MEKQKVMSIGAHADDIEVGAGGTLLKCQDQGYDIVYVMSTNNMSGMVQELQKDGSVKCWKETTIPMMERRKRECTEAAAKLGTTPIHLDHPQRHYSDGNGEQIELRYGCSLPEGVPASIPSILTAYEDEGSIQRLTKLILDHDPAAIFSHGMSSANIEHLASSMLVTQSYWQAVDEGYKGALLQWREDCTAFGPINFKWDTYIDISDYLDQRMELLGTHACQMPTAHEREHGHRLRVKKNGIACGCKAAEVFTWVSQAKRPNLDSTRLCYSPLEAELLNNTK